MNQRPLTGNEFLLLKKIEEIPAAPAMQVAQDEEDFVPRMTVIAIIREHYHELAIIERALNALARRGGQILFCGNYVKIKFPDCPAFTADNLREGLAIALKLSPEGGP